MRIGVHVVSFDVAGGTSAIASTLAQTAQLAEQGGVDNLSVMDHYLQMQEAGLGPVDQPMLEGYTTLGFLAGRTSSAELQLLVTGVGYRHPGLLAKIVSTLDVLSGGRAVLGIGAGWFEREHAAFGVPFPPVAERFERLEETLQIVRRMWSDDVGPYEGRHYRLAETINSPQPLRTPPIMIGGGGERKTLRLVAKYADATNLFARGDLGPEAVRAKLAVLADHCEREGTDYERIRRTILWTEPVATDPQGARRFVDTMEAFAAVGVEEVHVMPYLADPIAFVTGLGENVVPALHRIT